MRSWFVNAEGTALEARSAAQRTDPNLEALFELHYRRVARVIGRVIGDPSRAEEIAADVFVRYGNHPSAWGDRAEGWIYLTASRAAIDEWRRQQRAARLQSWVSWLLPRPDRTNEANDDAARVRQVLAGLKARDAQVLLLWSEDVPYREIAAAFGVPVGRVGNLVSRALAAFRKGYGKRYGTKA